MRGRKKKSHGVAIIWERVPFSLKRKNGTLIKLKQFNDTVYQKEEKCGHVSEQPEKRHILLQIVSSLLSLTAFICFIVRICFSLYLRGNKMKVLMCAVVCFFFRCVIEAVVIVHRNKQRISDIK